MPVLILDSTLCKHQTAVTLHTSKMKVQSLVIKKKYMESCEYIAVVYGQHFIPADTILQALDARFNFSRCKGT